MATKSIAWTTGDGNITMTYQGYGDGDITVNSDPNNLDTARSQTITIETTAGSPTVVKNFTVSQGACPFPVGDVRNFAYTSSVQSVVLPAGKYKLQCWGAQGGTCSSGYSGGKGGYSEGVLTLTSPTTVYIFVGGQGSSSGNGGWNGGGGGSGSSSYNSSNEYGSSTFGCGGGATDIALVTSSMDYSSYRNVRSAASLLSRMIVAGGGSGGAYGYQKVTTSTTTWSTYSNDEYTTSNYEPKDSTYWGGTSLSLTTGKTYRVSYTILTGSMSEVVIELYDANWGHFVKGTTVTPQSYHTRQYVRVRASTSSNSARVLIEEKNTTSSTTTDSDSKVGYVGGGTNGGGYSSSYYGKQNGAGSNGSFGFGANQTVTNYRYGAGCGGGGWYGGGNSYSDSGLSTIRCSGGGSGFVNTSASAGNRPSGYTGLQLDSGTTYAGEQSFPAVDGGNETGHSGDGYARITRIAAYTVTLRFKDEEDSPITGTSVTVSNSEYTYSLTTDSNGEATATMQNGTYNLSCSGYSLTPSQIIVSSNSTIDIVAAAPSIMDFSYTGAVQNATLRAGTYKIECWGAQGGYRSSTTYGGKGGYSVGELTLSQNTNIYVYVGGAGNTGGTSGGFNGGGMRATYAGGGGGSDVRIGTDSLYARVIVAGGGGSDGATSKQGMYGGGTTGGTTTQSYGTGGGGGTQTSGGTGSSSASGSGTSGTYGAFGVGGRGYKANSGYAGAGGGGWYGGAGSYPDGSGDDDRGGGGGSGYVYTSSTASSYPSGCLLNSNYYLTNSQTIAGNASMPSTSGSTETGHSGNGYVRITKI